MWLQVKSEGGGERKRENVHWMSLMRSSSSSAWCCSSHSSSCARSLAVEDGDRVKAGEAGEDRGERRERRVLTAPIRGGRLRPWKRSERERD